jgi:DNA-binding NarL/FixJ family response regulator
MRVVIADDHRLILDGVRRALETDGDFEIVGETQSGKDVLDLVKSTSPDMVLLDVRMPDMDGLACLDLLRARFPDVKVVMLSASTSPDLVESALRRGASAYVVKSVEPADLPSTLRQVASGTVFSSLAGPEPTESASDAAGLTEREIAILAALARGLSNEQIAKELWVARQTVKFHLTNVYRKLGVKSRTEAIHRAYQLGLVERPGIEDSD